MFFISSLMTPIAQGLTKEKDAWEDGYYETSRLNYELPAVRLHGRHRACGGSWYAVDQYDTSVRNFQNLMALVTQKGRPWVFSHPSLDRYILLPGTAINVGMTKEQGFHDGGGLQFEYVTGPSPQLLDHASSPKRVRL